MLRIRLLLGLLVLGANLLQGGCQQAPASGIQRLHVQDSQGRLHVYEYGDQAGDWREVGIIPAPRGMKFPAPSEPDLPRGSVEHGVDLWSYQFKANCGTDDRAFYRYRNATSQPIELVFKVTNDSKRCIVLLVGRLMPQDATPEQGEKLIANGDPGGGGGGSVEIPPGREMAFAFRCLPLEEGDHICLGRIEVSRH